MFQTFSKQPPANNVDCALQHSNNLYKNMLQTFSKQMCSHKEFQCHKMN
jgi:hypothetical protein